jgi:hypothetical protein
MSQLDLPLSVSIEREIDGLDMGVLEDGTPFLHGRALAKMCGAAPSSIIGQAAAWAAGKRDGRLAQKLIAAGVESPLLYVPTSYNQKAVHAYTEQVCMVFLDYYAFDAATPSEQARNAFRKLATAGLRLFVYRALGYDPSNSVPIAWRHFHDRMTLCTAPVGYFSIFKESADFVINAIRHGLRVDDKTIPDGSIGGVWGAKWRDENLDEQYGPRQRHEHNYPEYFPQSASNPQNAWAYPVEALPEFRRWMHSVYIPEKLPSYLSSKVSQGVIPPSTAELLLASVTPLALAEDV